MKLYLYMIELNEGARRDRDGDAPREEVRDSRKLWPVPASIMSESIRTRKTHDSTYRAALSYSSNKGIASSFMFLGTARTSAGSDTGDGEGSHLVREYIRHCGHG